MSSRSHAQRLAEAPARADLAVIESSVEEIDTEARRTLERSHLQVQSMRTAIEQVQKAVPDAAFVIGSAIDEASPPLTLYAASALPVDQLLETRRAFLETVWLDQFLAESEHVHISFRPR